MSAFELLLPGIIITYIPETVTTPMFPKHVREWMEENDIKVDIISKILQDHPGKAEHDLITKHLNGRTIVGSIAQFQSMTDLMLFKMKWL